MATGGQASTTTVVVVIDGPIARDDLPGLCERVRVVLEVSDAGVAICDMSGLTDPDARTVDALARLQLTARRLGRRLGLRNASQELQELLALMGLDDVVPCAVGLSIRPRGQAEQREQPRGVEEGDVGDDLPP